MNAVMIIAYIGFRDEEYLEPKNILEKNGVIVTTASQQLGIATGKFGTEAMVDIKIDQIDVNKYDAIIFIGGTGCKEYWDNITAHRIAKEAVESNKILAGICSAPVILARAGILKNRRATCYKGDVEELQKEGAIYTGNPVEQDSLIITADGPNSATNFGKKIVEALRGIY